MSMAFLFEYLINDMFCYELVGVLLLPLLVYLKPLILISVFR